MAKTASTDFDYLAARLHGRRARAAHGARLDQLCKSATIDDLARETSPDRPLSTSSELQQALLHQLLREFSEAALHVDPSGRLILGWMRERFDVENLKLQLRGIIAQATPDEVQRHWVQLPAFPGAATKTLPPPRTIEDWVARLPDALSSRRLSRMAKAVDEHAGPFLLEAALDQTYFLELLKRGQRLPGPERDLVMPIFGHQANAFQLMLIVRGRFVYGLAAETLAPFYIPSLPAAVFNEILASPDLPSLALWAQPRIIDKVPSGLDLDGTESPAFYYASELERLASHRLLKLANRAFRQNHLGPAAIIGYFVLRRIELANLIAVTEGIRSAAGVESIRAHLVPRSGTEVARA
jgi:vacuolar-type H+-ATPase subunit C/Vma6